MEKILCDFCGKDAELKPIYRLNENRKITPFMSKYDGWDICEECVEKLDKVFETIKGAN